MDVRILGPLEVWAAGRELALGGTKASAVLAMLVLNLNRVVSMDALVDGLWGPGPPDTATNAIQVNISRLRKTLQGDRPGPSTGGVLKWRRSSFQVDRRCFRRIQRQTVCHM